MKRIIAAAIYEAERLLIARRSYGTLKGFWEFPGGKVESGESDEECIKREIREEFAVEIELMPNSYLGSQHFISDGKECMISLYKATLLNHTYKLSAHDQIAWILPSQLLHYPLAPVDIQLAQKFILKIE